MAELFVTNFNRNFTGVSATAASVLRQQTGRYDLRLVGHPLPGAPDPIPLRRARALSRTPPEGRSHVIWHVRRNTEMRAAIWARDILRLPIRIVFTSAAQRRHSAFPRWLIARMDAVIATTPSAAVHVPHVRAVVPHGVDTDRFLPADDRGAAWRALGHGGARGIATIGRIRPEKGTDVFVQAMIELLPNLPDVVALVVGKAAREHVGFLTNLKAQIRAAGLEDRIRFVGEIPPQQLPDLMRGLSLVVQVPRYEGFGMVPLEGMASGVPFVATDAGAYSDFAAQGRSGVIVDTEAREPVARAAAGILGDPARFQQMAQAARALAVDRFSARAEADGIDAVYRQIWAG